MNRAYLFAVGALAASPFGSYAQDASGQHETIGLSEIVVTAERRAENLQQVPISLTAFTGEDLEKTNVKSATDYLMQVPNVSFTNDKQAGARGLSLAIRGVQNLVAGENAFVNSTGLYLDEFSIASVPNGLANPFLPDMERIEVLRGPQGTTFGRNALGGALNLTSRAPTDMYEGSVQVGGEGYAGTGHAENFTGVWNMPFTDTFKMRAVGYYEHSDGFVKNIGPGNQPKHDWINLRLRGAWTPSSDTRLNFTIVYGKEKQGGDETVPSGVLDIDTTDSFGIGRAIDPGTGFWATGNYDKLSNDLQQRNDLSTVVATANLSHDFSDHLTWKNIVGDIESTNDRYFDNDFVGGADILSRTNHYTGQSRSLETRLESRNSGWDWTLGAMFSRDKQDQHNNTAVSSDAAAPLPGYPNGLLPPFPPGLSLGLDTKHYRVESFAAFADATWHATDATELFAGARFTHDSVHNTLLRYGIAPGLNPDPTCGGFFQCFGVFPHPWAQSGVSFNDVSPRIGVRHKLNETVNVYATVSKGYKAGGTTNSPIGNEIGVPFKKEQLWNYEAGFKSEFADHRVRLNVSVFYMKWKDLQLEAHRFVVPGDLSTDFEQTVNVPKADSKGVEIELTARATQHLTFGGSVGLLRSELLQDPACSRTDDPTNPCINGHEKAKITGGFDVTLKGLTIPNSPRTTVNLFSEYRWPVGENSAWGRLEYQHRDSVYSDIEGLTNMQTRGPDPNQLSTGNVVIREMPYGEFPYKVPSFDVFNLRAGYDWTRVSLNLYVQNLTGEHYYTGSNQKFGLSGIRLRPNPRTIGASVNYRF